MPHYTPFIATIVFALVLAYAAGALALQAQALADRRLSRWPASLSARSRPASLPITARAELSEIGVILLMFGVGLHFSLGDLLAVRAIAIPGARADRDRDGARRGARVAARLVRSSRVSCSGWRCRSRARSCCCARSKEQRALDTGRGRIAVGWLIVEDLATVLVLVLLPALGRCSAAMPTRRTARRERLLSLGVTLAKVGAFVALMLFVGRRAIPWLLIAWPAPARASCSRCRCSRSRSASRSGRRGSSVCRSRSARSSRADPRES